MQSHPPRRVRWRQSSLAGLLAFIAALAVAAAWFHDEARWNSRIAGVMLVGFSLAVVIVSLRSPSLMAASIRIAVGAALLLVSVAWARTSSTSTGWQYRSIYHWIAFWGLATFVLPLLLVRAIGRAPATSTRDKWLAHLRQVPAGFLLFLLALLLSLAIGFVLVQVMTSFFPGPPAPPSVVLEGAEGDILLTRSRLGNSGKIAAQPKISAQPVLAAEPFGAAIFQS